MVVVSICELSPSVTEFCLIALVVVPVVVGLTPVVLGLYPKVFETLEDVKSSGSKTENVRLDVIGESRELKSHI